MRVKQLGNSVYVLQRCTHLLGSRNLLLVRKSLLVLVLMLRCCWSVDEVAVDQRAVCVALR